MRAGRNVVEVEAFDERQFYLEEFRGRTLLLVVHVDEIEEAADERALAGVLRTLAENDTRVILLVGTRDAAVDAAPRLGERIAALLPHEVSAPTTALSGDLATTTTGATAATVAQVWGGLRKGPLFVGVVADVDETAVRHFGALIATHMRVHKLILLDRAGGLCGSDGRTISFLDEAALSALLEQGEAEWTGLAARLDLVTIVRQALVNGVTSVNTCTLLEVARELFTYEGSGTLFTLEDYCHIERLGVDDFEEAERLIERGQREGVLKPRTPAEVALILANGYGATIATHQLAGICAFITEPYKTDAAGEVVGLYTITRFKGEGVGDRLVDHILDQARADGLQFVFATTTSARAQSFFERRGFRRVDIGDVPVAKWIGYDDERKRRAAVLRLDLK